MLGILSRLVLGNPNDARWISSSGVRLVKAFEGFSLKAYKDTGGVWTIGWGSTAGVFEGLTICERTAREWLLRDLTSSVNAVRKLVRVPLEQYQFDALVSFVYNVGIEAFRTSTLLRLLNTGDYNSVPKQLRRWVYDDGKVISGLVKRRDLEADVFARKITL